MKISARSICLALTLVGASASAQWKFEEARKTTNSQRYEWLESDSPAREKWIRAQNSETNLWLDKLKNKNGIEKWLRASGDLSKEIQSRSLKDGSILSLRDQGLGKPTELIWSRIVNGEARSRVVFSNWFREKNNSYYFEGFTLSPDEKYLAITSFYHGSIDKSEILILELIAPNGAILRGTIPTKFEGDIAWKISGGFPIVYVGINDNQLAAFDVRNLKTPKWVGEGYVLAGKKQWNFVTIYGASNGPNPEPDETLIFSDTGKEFRTKEGIRKVLGVLDDILYFVPSNSDIRLGKFQIRRGLLQPDGTINVENSFVLENFMLDYATLEKTGDGHTVASLFGSWGPNRLVALWDQSTNETHVVEVPSCCEATAIVRTGDKLKITLADLMGADADYFYDLSKKIFDRDPNSQPLLMGDKKLVTKVEQVSSLDGTPFFIRMTHLEELKQDSMNPVLISVYGGFRYSEEFYAEQLKSTQLKILEKGGILVGGTVRGGSEFGETWHVAGYRENKIKTIQDTAAIAKYLIEKKWTTNTKVVLTGSSNGGFVAAATGLLYPEYFGLIVPRVGVHDMLHKIALDTDNDGWASEYGNETAEIPFQYLSQISPLELASDGNKPNFFVVGGQTDTRVNPAHSYKLFEALKDNRKADSGYARFYALKYAGHGGNSMTRQDYIGWRSNVFIYSAIFEQWNWEAQ